MTEDEIQALVNGDRLAYNKLLDTYAEKVLNLAFNLVHSKEDAEDITQEVFSIVYTSIASFKGESALGTWIYRITLNKCQEQFRRKSRKKRFAFFTSTEVLSEKGNEPAQSDLLPDELLEQTELEQQLISAIQRLPEQQRIVFTLHKLEDFSYAEIVKLTDHSLSAVESLMFRAKRKLKADLELLLKKTMQ